MTLFNEANSF